MRDFEDFNGQCVALALDFEEGTPGYGWGVGDDKEAAQREALVREFFGVRLVWPPVLA